MPKPILKPATMLQPFANAGTKNTIPDQPDNIPGHASLELGFPPLTMTRIEQGGVPPSGRDFNGILNAISQHTAWLNAGGRYRFAAELSAYTGGYPKGAVLQGDDGANEYVSLVDNNTTDFNSDPTSIGVKWAIYAGDLTRNGVTTITTTGGSVTLTTPQHTNPTVIVVGALTSNLALTFPATVKTWRIINKTTGPFATTAKSAGSAATPLPITQGKANTVLADGGDLVFPMYDSGLDSPAFRGVPTAPTAVAGTSTTQLASTAFVGAAVSTIVVNAVARYVNPGTPPVTAGTTGDFWVDTRAGAVTITLPAAAADGNPLIFRDIAGTWGTNPLTIARNGKTIDGSATDLICNLSGEQIGLWYDAAASNWRII